MKTVLIFWLFFYIVYWIFTRSIKIVTDSTIDFLGKLYDRKTEKVVFTTNSSRKSALEIPIWMQIIVLLLGIYVIAYLIGTISGPALDNYGTY